MKSYALVIIVAISFLFSGCKKEENLQVNFFGKIQTIDGKGVPNVKVNLFHPGDGWFSLRDDLASAITDSEGVYLFQFERKPTRNPRIELTFNDHENSDDLDYLLTNKVPWTSINVSTHQNYFRNNYFVPKKGFVNVTLNNFIPIEENDFFKAKVYFSEYNFLNPDWNMFCCAGYKEYNATSSQNTTFNIPCPIGTTFTIEIHKMKSGVFSTTEYEVETTDDSTLSFEYEY